MKKIFRIALMAALSAGIVSCTKDATENNGGDLQGSSNKFTFVLPAQSNVITYAAHDHAVEAIGDESTFDLTQTSIYIFGADGVLEAVVNSDIQKGTHNGRPTATIEVDNSWNWSGSKTFFMVANTDKEGGSSLPTSSAVGSLTVTAFKDQMTSAMAATSGVADAAFSSTGGMILADFKQVTDVETAPATELELHRTVARIDIHNDVTFGKVTIKSISVSDANLNGYMFASNRSVPTANLVKGDIRDIAVSATLSTGVAANNIWGTTTPEDATHQYQKQAAVAYLYPTALKAGNATGTEITLIGEVNGVPAVYTMNKEDANGNLVDVELKANTRYVISAIDQLTKTFILTIADWDEGDSLVGRPGTSNSFGLIAAPTTVTGGTYVNGAIKVNPATAVSFDLDFKATSALGVSVAVAPQTGTNLVEMNGTKIATSVSTANTVTYATPYYKSTVSVSIAAEDAVTAAENFFSTLVVTDNKTDEELEITIYHAGDDYFTNVKYPAAGGVELDAVVVGGIVWAPVNVGAKIIAEALTSEQLLNDDYIGYQYQWGRNFGFSNTLYPQQIPSAVCYNNGAASTATYEEAMTGAAAGKFIRGGNWLSESDPNYEDCLDYWRKNTNTPCPEGWEIPSEKHFKVLFDLMGAAENFAFVIDGDKSGDKLILPFTGYRWGVDAVRCDVERQVGFWQCEYSKNSACNPTTGMKYTNGNMRTTTALSIRCVKSTN